MRLHPGRNSDLELGGVSAAPAGRRRRRRASPAPERSGPERRTAPAPGTASVTPTTVSCSAAAAPAAARAIPARSASSCGAGRSRPGLGAKASWRTVPVRSTTQTARQSGRMSRPSPAGPCRESTSPTRGRPAPRFGAGPASVTQPPGEQLVDDAGDGRPGEAGLVGQLDPGDRAPVGGEDLPEHQRQVVRPQALLPYRGVGRRGRPGTPYPGHGSDPAGRPGRAAPDRAQRPVGDDRDDPPGEDLAGRQHQRSCQASDEPTPM